MLKLKDSNILLTGGHGFLGERVYAQLLKVGVPDSHIVRPTSKQLDLRIPQQAAKAVVGNDVVIHLAARVGGIGYNLKHPGELFYDNATMGINLIEAARKVGVKKFIQVGTVCAYPKFTPVPFKESSLWNGYPEETNAPYGLAKLMLLEMQQAYRKQYNFNGIYLLPVNLYGPGDNFDPESSHVIPALIRKFVEAVKSNQPTVTVWGTGKATREFLYVDDAARAIVMAAEHYDKPEPVNVGSHSEQSIKNLVVLIAKQTGFKGSIVWDTTKPDGQPRRKLDIKRAQKEFNFISKINFETGLKRTIQWFKENYA